MKRKGLFRIALFISVLTYLIPFHAIAADKEEGKGKKKKAAATAANVSLEPGGIILLDNPYGENSSEWAVIDLYSEPNFQGEHWNVDIYGTKVTIKNGKNEVVDRFKDNFFSSAKIQMIAQGSVYLYDSSQYNRNVIENYAWAFLPSSNASLDIPDFDKETTSADIGKAYYKIKKSSGSSMKGGISSIILKFSKMK